jgi:hypothetical protein
MEDRRRASDGTTAISYLRELPSLVLLNRLPVAMLSVGMSGAIGYANATCAQLLGYADGAELARIPLPQLLADHSDLAPEDCVGALCEAKSTVLWTHAQGYTVRTLVSKPLLMRATDVQCLISLTDVTEQLWEHPHER